MALTAKERERIIEEETLRFETRQNLLREQCGQHRGRRRRWWWLAALVLAVALYCHFECREEGCSWGHARCAHAGMMEGKKCPYHGSMDQEGGVEPGQPIPPKK